MNEGKKNVLNRKDSNAKISSKEQDGSKTEADVGNGGRKSEPESSEPGSKKPTESGSGASSKNETSVTAIENLTSSKDPLANFSLVTESDGHIVYIASVASNPANEDRILVDSSGLFCVFDGHGGSECSAFASSKITEQFGKNYARKSSKPIDDIANLFFSSTKSASSTDESGNDKKSRDAKAALKNAFVAMDAEFLDTFGRKCPTTGSCGLACFIEAGVIWSAVVGDSRAILVRKREHGKPMAVDVTEDQNTLNRSECLKVVARSGDADAIRLNQAEARGVRSSEAVRRVAGTLMVTRALGDGYLKRTTLSAPPYVHHLPYITAKPKVRRTELRADDVCLVLASDGIWEHMSSAEVAEEATQLLARAEASGGDGAGEGNPAAGLIEAAIQRAADKQGVQAEELKRLPPGRLRRSYLDDISVIVVRLGCKAGGRTASSSSSSSAAAAAAAAAAAGPAAPRGDADAAGRAQKRSRI